MQIILFEDKKWIEFLPLVYTRPVGDLRVGMLTICEKWERALHATASHETRPYLRELFPEKKAESEVLINARLLPDEQLVDAIHALKDDEALMFGDVMLAARSFDSPESSRGDFFQINYSGQPLLLEKVTDIFAHNAEALKRDFAVLTKGRTSGVLHASNTVIGPPAQVFIDEGAQVWASTINTNAGPVFIDKHAEVMEGSHIRGPFYLGEYSVLKMATKVYGATTIGPHCKVGGEISNSVIHGYSNKAHDGFLGNSILGEWCNLGADTNTSNLKNNYSHVRVWNDAKGQYADTGLTFCGLIMGDHSKCSINTMFNTGTVAGISANIFGGDFPPKNIPSFSWGGAAGFSDYELDKAFETMEKVFARRNLPLTATMKAMLENVFKETAHHRLAATQSQE